MSGKPRTGTKTADTVVPDPCLVVIGVTTDFGQSTQNGLS
jgi:hypothetical protein